MIRIIVGMLFLTTFLLISYMFFPILNRMEKTNKVKKDKICLRVVQWGFRIILKIAGTKVTVIGKENIPTDTAVVYVGNHRSIFDIVIYLVMSELLALSLTENDGSIFKSLIPLITLTILQILVAFIIMKSGKIRNLIDM